MYFSFNQQYYNMIPWQTLLGLYNRKTLWFILVSLLEESMVTKSKPIEGRSVVVIMGFLYKMKHIIKEVHSALIIIIKLYVFLNIDQYQQAHQTRPNSMDKKEI
jgi:hypothetical protein